jgi:broad specificity phosphatase PhoE
MVKRSDEEAGTPGRLILVRHGESEGNRDRTFTHSGDVPLTEVGKQQAQRVAAVIAEQFAPARVVASPFARARVTGEIIATALSLRLDVVTELHEQSFGIFAGRPYEAVLEDPSFSNTVRWQWRPAQGESLADVRARVTPALESIARADAGRDVVVVSHGGVMLSICAHILGTWEGIAVVPNCGVLVVEHDGGILKPPRRLEDG